MSVLLPNGYLGKIEVLFHYYRKIWAGSLPKLSKFPCCAQSRVAKSNSCYSINGALKSCARNALYKYGGIPRFEPVLLKITHLGTAGLSLIIVPWFELVRSKNHKMKEEYVIKPNSCYFMDGVQKSCASKKVLRVMDIFSIHAGFTTRCVSVGRQRFSFVAI